MHPGATSDTTEAIVDRFRRLGADSHVGQAESSSETGQSVSRLVAIIVLLLFIPGPLLAQDEELDTDTLNKQIDGTIEWFEIFATDAGREPLVPKKVLRWDNVSRGSKVGLTLLYIGNGRPEVVCCIYPWQKSLVHEFVSLSRGGVRGNRMDSSFWNVVTPGVDFKPIPAAPRPSDTLVGRRSQMKRLARRFEGTLLGWKRDDSDRQVLRLLPRPLYEYQEPKGAIDGAVFSFTMGVDPEILLIIEAVPDGEKARWEYAIARKTSGELEVTLDGKSVWHADRFPVTSNAALANRNVKYPLALLEEAE